MKSAEPKPNLKIGEVARLAGISPSVIRSWERLGLTRPRRTASQYRVYTPEDVKLLKRARFLRKVRGLNAPAIVQLLRARRTSAPACERRQRSHRRPIYANAGSSAGCLSPRWRSKWASPWDF